VTEALPSGYGVALVLELGELTTPSLAGCDFVRMLVEIVDVRAHHLDRPHARASDPVREEISCREAEDDEDGVADRSGGDASVETLSGWRSLGMRVADLGGVSV
jgi:hypothetical protein